MATKVSEGTFTVSEGGLYWKYEQPASNSAQPSSSSNNNNSNPKPTLLFLHAAVSDHTVWEGQTPYFLSKGYPCLRVDRFGFGKSHASSTFVDSTSKKPVDHVDHLVQLLKHLDLTKDDNSKDEPPAGAPTASTSNKIIAVGLSMGGSTAFDLATSRPEIVIGLVVVAGGFTDMGEANTAEEEALSAEIDTLRAKGPNDDGDRCAEDHLLDLALLQVRYWGDGPLQRAGRMEKGLADRMVSWNREIGEREMMGTGGTALEMVDSGAPDVKKVAVPTLIASGVYDETYTNTGMGILAKGIAGSEAREFEAAHMIPMERVEEFNGWLGEWLERKFA